VSFIGAVQKIPLWRRWTKPVRGTLGIILAAKQQGMIPFARPLVERMRQSGMYLSDSVMNSALAIVGE
jgi:predicted nucleic acid-binding protein